MLMNHDHDGDDHGDDNDDEDADNKPHMPQKATECPEKQPPHSQGLGRGMFTMMNMMMIIDHADDNDHADDGDADGDDDADYDGG